MFEVTPGPDKYSFLVSKTYEAETASINIRFDANYIDKWDRKDFHGNRQWVWKDRNGYNHKDSTAHDALAAAKKHIDLYLTTKAHKKARLEAVPDQIQKLIKREAESNA